MTEIELPILLDQNSKTYQIPAKASAFVSLDEESVKGIHMSRLFSRLQELAQKSLTSEMLENVVKSFQESHKDSSKDSELRLAFNLVIPSKSLISNMTGWRHYPVEFVLIYEAGVVSWLAKYSVVYSSTCPCSAALSRQLIQEKFMGDFGKRSQVDTDEVSTWLAHEDSICATPHSQRSFAKLALRLKKAPADISTFFTTLIQQTESCLKTPVQSFVKREDEQEFARLNAENLMFCEDAARRLQDFLKSSPQVKSFSIEVEHQESLHPHNAVARVWSETDCSF